MWRAFAALGSAALLLSTGCGGGGSSTTSAAQPLSAPSAVSILTKVTSFAAVLQNVGENGPSDAPAIAALGAAPYHVELIDEIGTSTSAYANTEAAIVAQLHAAGKIAIGYVDIGEAETFRSYWQPGWQPGAPTFLLAATDPNGFPGDYPVDFGDPQWQAIVYGHASSLIDRALADGFDGVYLDWVTGYDFTPVLAKRPNAQAVMASFVSAISTYAKARNPAFVIIAQSAPELVANTTFTSAIDGVLNEALFYGNSASAIGDLPQAPATTAAMLTALRPILAQGKPVFSIDYATTTANAADAYARAKAAGVVEYVGTRDLNALSRFPPP